jgi:hypothetical protein
MEHLGAVSQRFPKIHMILLAAIHAMMYQFRETCDRKAARTTFKPQRDNFRADSHGGIRQMLRIGECSDDTSRREEHSTPALSGRGHE